MQTTTKDRSIADYLIACSDMAEKESASLFKCGESGHNQELTRHGCKAQNYSVRGAVPNAQVARGKGRKVCACKPGSVSRADLRLRGTSSFISATYPPGPDEPPSTPSCDGDSRSTWSYCPQGFPEPWQLPAMLVGSYPTFSPLPVLPQAVLISAALSVSGQSPSRNPRFSRGAAPCAARTFLFLSKAMKRRGLSRAKVSSI